MMRPILTAHEWALKTLAGTAAAVARGTVSQAQLDGLRRTFLRWGVNAAAIELTIQTKKAPSRAGIMSKEHRR